MSERLEDIKRIYAQANEIENINGVSIIAMSEEDKDWLIKQAERVEELEEERDEWKDTAKYYYMTNQDLREQNKRYRKAIDYIIERVMLFGTNEEVYEAIQDAIKALESNSD